MTAQFIAMEKTIEASELLEMVVETEAGAGARGLSVAGGGKEGLFVKDVLKDSPAARVLSLQEGDQLLSARVYFDNIKYEDALQILKCAEPYKISFCLKRVVPSKDVSRKPGATVFEVRGPKAKMAKLNIQSLSSLKRKKKRRRRRMVSQSLQETEAYLAVGKLEGPPVDVEFSFPKLFKLRKARSAGEVAVAEPGPDSSRRLSSLETKQHRLKFPRLKVKEVAAAEARLALGMPHVGLELKKAGRGGGGEGKMFRFIIPFSKTKKPKEEAGPKMEVGFQGPQVEFALPLLKMGAEEELFKPGPEGENLAVLESRAGWPKVEAALPKGSASVMETHPGLLQAGLKLPAAEVAAPKVEVDLALPKLECAAPEAAPKREGFRIKVPKFGISAEEAELKLPLVKIPALEMAVGESREKVLEEQFRPGGAVPSMGIVTSGVDLKLSFPKGKTAVESPEISGRLPLANLAQERGAGKLPQVEVSVGKPESPKADKTKGSVIQLPGLEISLREQPLDSQEAAGAASGSQVSLPEVRVPSLDISAPKVQDMHLCKAMGEPAAPSGRAKPKEAAEGAGFKFQIPQISLPKFDFPVKAAPSPPPVQLKMPKPEGDLGTKASFPKVDVSLLAMKVPGVQLPKVPKQEVGISAVEKPKVEMTVPPTPLSIAPATQPALDIELPSVGVELGLAEREREVSEQGPKAHVTLETLSRELEVEISLPKGAVIRPELELGMKGIEGPPLAGMVAQFPKGGLAFEKQPVGAEGPKADLEGAKMKLPTVEISSICLPETTAESQAKAKLSRFALSKFSISAPKVWSKTSPEVAVSGMEGTEAANLGTKGKLPKFGISFPKSKWEAEAEDAKLGLKTERETLKERLGKTTESRMRLPTVAIDIGHPQGMEGWYDGDGEGTSPEPLGVKFKGPKISLLSFGGKGKEEQWGALESGGVKLKVSKEGSTGQLDPRILEDAKTASKFRVASLGLVRREVEAKAKKVPESPKEKPKGPFGKMPQLKLPSLTAQGERKKFHLSAPELDGKVLPQVELPKLAPRAKADLIPEPESPGFKVQVPSVEIAVPSSKGEGAATVEKPAGGASKAEIQHEGSTEVWGFETGVKEGQLKVPTLSLGLGKLERETGMGTDESRFRLKLLSLEVSKPEAELSLDTHPLCPSVEEAAPSFRMPQIALPDVGFSGHQERGEEAKVAGATNLELGLEMLKMPKIAITACGVADTKEGTETATSPSQMVGGGGELEGKKLVFKVPGLEISAPSLKTHAEYEAGVPPTQQRGSLDLEGAGRESWKQTDRHSDAGKRLKVRIPKFGLFLPRVGSEATEGLVGQEMEAQGGLLALRRPEEKKGSGGLLEREEESQAKAAKLKLRAPFGVSLSRPKGATELNRGAEAASSKVKVPKLGFSKAEGSTQLQGEREEGLLQGGASKLGKIPLPQVELLSPSKGAESDSELSLKLVKAEEAKEEAHSSVTISASLKAAKFKPPRIALPGFKKRNGELAPEAVTAPRPQAETTAKGEPFSKFSFPKLALSSISQEALDISKHRQDEEGGNFRLLAMAFSAESGPGEEGRKLSEKEAL